jgi:hypothetical protein
VAIDTDVVLEKIFELRSRQAYQDAEILRQASDAETMAASSDPASNGAIRLLVATWEEIARLLSTVVKDLKKSAAKRKLKAETDTIFKATPVGYVWDGLEPGILYIRRNLPGYAKQFEALNKAYSAWLRTQSASYRSRVKQGMNAMFG